MEKQKMERVFSNYVQKRLKAENKVQKLIKENQERLELEKIKAQEKFLRIR
jgi:hypothetical protein